ncbi:hypothetical protein FRC10_009426 [Ceratobasidium sp. 414]|nr:hypothetical protein FRC10_009426 [Ceratobasidium sp. 414]
MAVRDFSLALHQDSGKTTHIRYMTEEQVSRNHHPNPLVMWRTHLARHYIWGRPGSTYFLKDPANAFFPNDRPIPTIQHIQTTAIPHLEQIALHGQPTYETCDMLKSVLSLVYHVDQLSCLNNSVLLRGCMRALRSYTGTFGERGQGLFTYEFGFLCFQAIVLLVQVDILTRTKTLDSFVGQNTHVSDPNDISLALSAHVSQLILDAAEDESFRKWLFGSPGSQSGDQPLQAPTRGIEGVDFGYFVKAIWRSRLEFTQICAKFRSSGWSFVLLLLGEYLRYTFENGV